MRIYLLFTFALFAFCTGAFANPVDEGDACRVILLNPGLSPTNTLDSRIREAQQKATGAHGDVQIDRLGWLFVEKARVSNDPGYYKLASECADCLETHTSNSLDVVLLRGHVLQSLHRFKEAEPLALRLVKSRGLAFDYGLLGDIEYDQGKIPEAVAAYQQMANIRPDLQAYSRVAQVRWLTGDLPGALEAMSLAAKAGSPLNAEPTAWTLSRLALFQLQANDLKSAKQSAKYASTLQSDSAPAWMALGRVQWAMHQTNEAVESLKKAASLNHLPETQWLLADVLRAHGQDKDAKQIESELQSRGAAEDPRSYSLYLASRGVNPAKALTLAQKELDTRQDIFTHDALAWALASNKQWDAARAEMKLALAEGTQDARLFLHAALISKGAGSAREASDFAHRAQTCANTLYPSELAQLTGMNQSGELSQHNSGFSKNDPKKDNTHDN